MLHKIKPYHKTYLGASYFGDSLKLIKEVEDESIDLVLTSPPFALTRKKEYGNKSSEEYVDWFLKFAYKFKRVLSEIVFCFALHFVCFTHL